MSLTIRDAFKALEDISDEEVVENKKINESVDESIYDKGLSKDRENILEFPNGEYFYVDVEDGKIFAGSATNSGIFHDYEIDYDDDLSLDQNLQNLYDYIIETKPELLDEPANESCENQDDSDELKEGDSDLVEDKKIPYNLVSSYVILRDWLEINDDEYINDEHKKLVDIADSLYNTFIDASEFDDEYKKLYEKYGKEYFDEVLDDCSAIDSQISDSNIHNLINEVNDLIGEDKIKIEESCSINESRKITPEFVDKQLAKADDDIANEEVYLIWRNNLGGDESKRLRDEILNAYKRRVGKENFNEKLFYKLIINIIDRQMRKALDEVNDAHLWTVPNRFVLAKKIYDNDLPQWIEDDKYDEEHREESLTEKIDLPDSYRSHLDAFREYIKKSKDVNGFYDNIEKSDLGEREKADLLNMFNDYKGFGHDELGRELHKEVDESVDDVENQEKWKSGDERVLDKESEELKAMQRVADKLNELSDDVHYVVDTTYLDAGQDWEWTTIIAHKDGGDDVLDTWQVLNPRQWVEICNGRDVDDIVDEIRNKKCDGDDCAEKSEVECMAEEIANKCNETLGTSITSDDIQYDEVNHSLYVEGKLLKLPVRRFGAFMNESAVIHNGRDKENTVELGKLFEESLSKIESLVKQPLNESEDIDINNDKDLEKGKKILKEKPKSEDDEKIVDVDANTVSELKSSYIGNVILQCPVCRTLLYKEPDKLVKSESGELYNVDEECPHCGSKDGYEIVGQVAEMSAGEDENKDDEKKDEVNLTVSDEKNDGEAEDDKNIDLSIDDLELEGINEDKFNTVVNRYINEVYDNVDTYKTSSCSVDKKNNNIVVEGTITYKDGKTRTTKFVLEGLSKNDDGSIKMNCYNKTFTDEDCPFSIIASTDNKSIVCESLSYDYKAHGVKINGTVKSEDK